MDSIRIHGEPLKQYIGDLDIDANFYAILSAVIVVILTIVFFYIFKIKKVNRRNVLITGLSESGKTVLFSKLVVSKKVVTYASMKENVAVYRPENRKSITLVDIPGNERLRTKYIDQFLPYSRGIIFVIDSFSFQQEIRDVANFLFALLQEPAVHGYRIPFLIACNKQDHAVAKGAKVIQSQIEKEMNVLRLTQTGRLESTAASGPTIFLGQRGKDFQFADLRGIRTEFIECSASETENVGINEGVKYWLSKIA